MDWLIQLLTGSSVAHAIFILAIVISGGLLLGKIKVFGISLGITWILFLGILLGHLGVEINPSILLFMKEFGLILFIYSIGMQVGPSFFSSFKKGGITLNLLATGIVLLGVVTTYIIHLVTGTPIATMIGVLSGAVTNTGPWCSSTNLYRSYGSIRSNNCYSLCSCISIRGCRNYINIGSF